MDERIKHTLIFPFLQGVIILTYLSCVIGNRTCTGLIQGVYQTRNDNNGCVTIKTCTIYNSQILVRWKIPRSSYMIKYEVTLVNKEDNNLLCNFTVLHKRSNDTYGRRIQSVWNSTEIVVDISVLYNNSLRLNTTTACKSDVHPQYTQRNRRKTKHEEKEKERNRNIGITTDVPLFCTSSSKFMSTTYPVKPLTSSDEVRTEISYSNTVQRSSGHQKERLYTSPLSTNYHRYNPVSNNDMDDINRHSTTTYTTIERVKEGKDFTETHSSDIYFTEPFMKITIGIICGVLAMLIIIIVIAVKLKRSRSHKKTNGKSMTLSNIYNSNEQDIYNHLSRDNTGHGSVTYNMANDSPSNSHNNCNGEGIYNHLSLGNVENESQKETACADHCEVDIHNRLPCNDEENISCKNPIESDMEVGKCHEEEIYNHLSRGYKEKSSMNKVITEDIYNHADPCL